VKHGQRTRGFREQVFHEHVGLERIIRIMVSSDAADKGILKIEWKGSVMLGLFAYLLHGDAASQLGDLFLAKKRVTSHLFLDLLNKIRCQVDEIEIIGDFNPRVEFLLGHDLAKLPVSVCVLHRMSIPGLRNLVEFVRMKIAYEDLIGRVCNRFVVTADPGVDLFLQFSSMPAVQRDVPDRFRAIPEKAGTWTRT